MLCVILHLSTCSPDHKIKDSALFCRKVCCTVVVQPSGRDPIQDKWWQSAAALWPLHCMRATQWLLKLILVNAQDKYNIENCCHWHCIVNGPLHKMRWRHPTLWFVTIAISDGFAFYEVNKTNIASIENCYPCSCFKRGGPLAQSFLHSTFCFHWSWSKRTAALFIETITQKEDWIHPLAKAAQH